MDYYEIAATGARFVEVIGDGPYTDKPGGVTVDDGQVLTAPCDIKTDYLRKFRADAPTTVTDARVAFDPPITLRLSVRRSVCLWWWPWWLWVLRVIVWMRGWFGLRHTVATARALNQSVCPWFNVKPGPDPEFNFAVAQGADVVIADFRCFGSGVCAI